MRRLISSIVLSALIVPTGTLLVGCDKTVEKDSTEIKRTDGPDVKVERKVTESPNGTVTKTEEKKVSP